ncbi:MAG: dienelactone hydrolase [Pseudomonadota bacterium]
MKHIVRTAAVSIAMFSTPLAAENRIDGQSTDAPELAAYGPLSVGVRKFEFVNDGQVDILAIDPAASSGTPLPTYDRPMTVEMWYPAIDGATGDTSLDAFIRDGVTQVELQGRGVRDAAPIDASEPFPLIVMSHGYPGNRFLLSHLAENLASKGYVVASIDHTDSTYRDQNQFASTLVNRPLDQLFVLDEMVRINSDPSSEFAGMIDTENAGLLGYSMGGYGAIITAGGGVTEAVVPFAPGGTLGIHQAGSDTHEALSDNLFKTAVAIGPWGRQFNAFDEDGLSGIDIPMLYIGGSNDTVSGYNTGIRPIWEETTGAVRSLLTFENGSHNTVAPIPAPAESFYFNDTLGFNVSEHYTDPVWDTVFMNNVGQHFTTAWFDSFLKGDTDKNAYLDLDPIGTGADWLGFAAGTSDGLRFETLSPDAVAPVPLPASAWLLGMACAGLGLARKGRRKA